MSPREYPKVWSQVERQVGGKTLKFEIKDIPESLWSTAVEFMLGNYIREDVWWSTAGTAGDKQAVEEYRVLLTSIIELKMSLACLLTEEGSGQILVAVNMCMPQKKGHFVDHNPPKSAAGLVSLRIFAEAMKVAAIIYDRYKVDEYLMGTGLSVIPKYRGLGIAVELLKARVELAQSLDFQATGGIFTSKTSQRSAEKAGLVCLHSTPYKEFGEQCNIVFDTDTENLKIFAIKIA